MLGPVPAARTGPGDPDEERYVVRVPRRDGAALARALAEAQRLRSARKLEPVRVQLDPYDL